MKSPKILVTGATGKTGALIVAELLKREMPVRAMVRKRDHRSETLERQGAEIAVADMYDPDQLLDAMRGTQRAYYLPPFQPHMIQSAAAFAVAARESKLEHIVQMSQWTSARAHPANMTRHIWLTDQLFSMTPGIAHTIFNPGIFADNFLRVIDFAALLYLYPVLSGDGKVAPVSNEDMAKSAAVLLVDGPIKHDGKRYRPTGPELLDARQMAKIISKVVGHRVFTMNMPFWMMGKVARQQGIDPFEVSPVRYYFEDIKKGTFSFEGGVTKVVEELTGTPAESFETTARRYASLPFAQQTFANRLKAFINFNVTPFYRGYNFDKFDKQLGLPVPPNPALSIDDAHWQAEHRAQMNVQGNSGKLLSLVAAQ